MTVSAETGRTVKMSDAVRSSVMSPDWVREKLFPSALESSHATGTERDSSAQATRAKHPEKGLLRYYGRYLTRERALSSIRIHRCDDVIIGESALNRGVSVVGAGIQSRVYLGIRSTGDGSAINVITNHIGRGACIPAQRDTV